jgi:hypothetical protein
MTSAGQANSDDGGECCREHSRRTDETLALLTPAGLLDHSGIECFDRRQFQPPGRFAQSLMYQHDELI